MGFLDGVMDAPASEYALRQRIYELESRLSELKEREDRRLRSFEAAVDAFLIHDLDGRIVDVNGSACELLGYRREELLRLSIADIECGFTWEELRTALGGADAGRRMRCPGLVRCRGGECVPVDVHANCFDCGGRRFVHAVLRDERRGRCECPAGSDPDNYKDIFDNLAVGVFQSTLSGRFLRVNPALARILGYGDAREALEEVRDIAGMIYIEPERRDEIIRSVCGSGVTERFDVRFRGRDGEEWHANVVLRMVYDAEGKPFYLEGVVEDVTERQKTQDALRSVKEELELENTMRTINLVVANERLKREIEERKKAEAELMESEERFRAIFESAEDAILVKNLRRVYTHVNPAMGRLLGMPISELIGRRVEDFLSLLDEAASLWDQDTHVLRGEVVKAETPLSLGERQVVLNIIKAPLRDDAGNIIGICGIARDITECKLGEERMRQSERRLRSLVENSLVGIMIVTNRRVVFCNQEMEKLLGTSPRNLDSGERGFQTKNLAKLLRLYRSVVGGKSKVLDEELELLRSEGTGQGASTKWVHCRASLIECKGRESVLFNIMDVTKLKEFEQLLRIEDKMTSLGHVAAGIAHEIRNPLTGINTYLHSLRRLLGAGVGDEEAVRMAQNIIEEIRSASGRINTVIRRVMDFSKPSLPQFALLDMNDCIDDVLALSAATLRKRSIQVDKRLRRGLPKCHADRQMMEQVLMNIVTNAAHAMKSSKGPRTLRIKSDGEDGAILVSISDSGPGVPEELRKKIFDPFFTTKSNGAGIGLSISQRIMADHLGSLLVGESSLGGAKFTLRMPAYAHVERDDE